MELLCRLLKASRSGYYEWLHRKPSAHEQQDQALKRQLLALHQRYPALGLDSLYHLIRRELSCSRKRALCLFHALYESFKAFLRLSVDVGKVCIQLAACEKIGVCNPTVLLQIVQMPLSPCAYRLFFFGGYSQAWY